MSEPEMLGGEGYMSHVFLNQHSFLIRIRGWMDDEMDL